MQPPISLKCIAAPEDFAVDIEAFAELLAVATGGTARWNGDSCSFNFSSLLDFFSCFSSLYENVLSNSNPSWSSFSSSTSSKEFLSAGVAPYGLILNFVNSFDDFLLGWRKSPCL